MTLEAGNEYFGVIENVKVAGLPTMSLLELIETEETVAAVAAMVVVELVLSVSITTELLESTEILIEDVGFSDLGFVTAFRITLNGNM